MTVDSAALAQVLGAVDLRLGIARRAPLDDGGVVALGPGSASLVYVASGEVHAPSCVGSGCTLDVDRTSQRIEVDASGAQRILRAGDAFLTLGGAPVTLQASEPSDLVVFDLEFCDETVAVSTLFPDPITVTAFDAIEPAAAALAGSMGPSDPPEYPPRQGDPLICRMMATTVVLSVIRAWAAGGCAPDGWPTAPAGRPSTRVGRPAAPVLHMQDPATSAGSIRAFRPADVLASRSRTQDPFLDRVIDAIHDQPGREWTVERLATVGAMSRSVFAERFRTTMGRSPADYVTEVRIESAKRLLESGRSVSETSRELGYGSDEGFSRAFRRRMGMTPSAWRAEQRLLLPA